MAVCIKSCIMFSIFKCSVCALCMCIFSHKRYDVKCIVLCEWQCSQKGIRAQRSRICQNPTLINSKHWLLSFLFPLHCFSSLHLTSQSSFSFAFALLLSSQSSPFAKM